MNLQDLTKLLKKAEKQVPVGVRAKDRLIELELQIKELHAALIKKEDWLKIRKLARHGKRIAARFKEERAKKFFGVLFNTASVYLGLPADRDWRAEAYALTRR